jgi:hypothetical protein
MKWDTYFLHSGLPQRESFRSIQPTSYYFPTVLAASQPEQKKVLRSLNAYMINCRKIKSKIIDRIDGKDQIISFLKKKEGKDLVWDSLLVSDCAEKIKKLLLANKSCGNTLKSLGTTIHRDDSRTCHYCIAFKTWLEFLGRNRNYPASSLDIISYTSYRFYLNKFLDVPAPMQFLWRENNLAAWYEQENLIILPVAMQRAIYEYELWICFINILALVKTIVTATNGLKQIYAVGTSSVKMSVPEFHVRVDNTDQIELFIPSVYSILPTA